MTWMNENIHRQNMLIPLQDTLGRKYKDSIWVLAICQKSLKSWAY